MSERCEEYLPVENPNRWAGLLLHPASVRGPYGIGDLGPPAYGWVGALAEAKQRWWQILPLGPTGYGDSPYQAFSAFAGNPFLVSPQYLREDGLLDAGDLDGVQFPAHRVDFGPVIQFKNRVLARAWQNFGAGRAAKLRPLFDAFVREHGGCLEDYALFMALKEANGGWTWRGWGPEGRAAGPPFF